MNVFNELKVEMEDLAGRATVLSHIDLLPDSDRVALKLFGYGMLMQSQKVHLLWGKKVNVGTNLKYVKGDAVITPGTVVTVTEVEGTNPNDVIHLSNGCCTTVEELCNNLMGEDVILT